MSNIKLFEEKRVRSIWNEAEQQWYFSIVDVIEVLTNSPNPQVYWRVLKKRLSDEGNETVTNCNALKMEAADGKMRFTDVANAQQLLRLIQSVPSPKAEPFKQWLAQVGYERMQEIENPELATQRARELYKAKGYPDDWIERRMRSIAIREELTDEWQQHGVNEQKEYSILTAQPLNYKGDQSLALLWVIRKILLIPTMVRQRPWSEIGNCPYRKSQPGQTPGH